MTGKERFTGSYDCKRRIVDTYMKKDILICGVGGQGTVLASKLIAAAAMEEGNTVHSAETIGMAQRGGSVTSHVRIGEAYSPLIPKGKCDMILAFEPAEAVRNLPYLKRDGLVIVSSAPVKPTTESLHETGYDGTEMIAYLREKCNVIVVDSEALCARYGSNKYLNVILLGVAAGSGVLGISKEAVKREIEKRVPGKYVENNRQAFEDGFAYNV